MNGLQDESAKIRNPSVRRVVCILLNVIEELVSSFEQLRSENQELRDALTTLKGEQGKSDITANTRKSGSISSETARKKAETTKDRRDAREGFKLDRRPLGKLKEQRIPVEIL
ncbi:MAG: hypothetical protein GY801_48390 [bacterium]|nr:hypothetical protein [bacterium]